MADVGLLALAKQYTDIRTPVGCMLDFAGSAAPTGWLLCDGSSYSKATYPNLFAVIGYTYGGSGDSFKVPDLRERVTVGYKSDSDTFDEVGKKVGEKSHTLTVNEMPTHHHSMNVTTGTDDLNFNDYNDIMAGDNHNNASVWHTSIMYDAGGSQAHNNIQPSFVCHKIIYSGG